MLRNWGVNVDVQTEQFGEDIRSRRPQSTDCEHYANDMGPIYRK